VQILPTEAIATYTPTQLLAIARMILLQYLTEVITTARLLNVLMIGT